MEEARSRALDSRPGAMTAAMQAVSSNTRSIRIGTLTPGQPIREYVALPGRHVRIGRTESCHVALDDPALGAAEILIRCVDSNRGRYVICLQPGMEAIVSRGHGPEHIAPTDEPVELLLEGDARGRVRVGKSWLLFQLVASPIPSGRPRLPKSVVNSVWSEVDWRFTIIAAVSFLAHFGGIGMLYTDWLDPSVDDPSIIAALADQIRTLPTVPELENVIESPTVDDGEVERRGPESKSSRPGGRARTMVANGREGDGEAAIASAMRELDTLNFQVLSAMDPSSGSATRDVLTDSALPIASLDELAKRNARVGSGDSTLPMGHISGPVGLGDISPGLESIGDIHRREAATVGVKTKVDGPKPVGAVEAPPRVTGEVPDAEAVVARMRAGFRRCYELGLLELPTMRGSVQVTVRVGPNGEVLSVSAAPTGSISSSVSGCVASRVRGAQFGPPRGGAAVITIPVKLTPQNPR